MNIATAMSDSDNVRSKNSTDVKTLLNLLKIFTYMNKKWEQELLEKLV